MYKGGAFDDGTSDHLSNCLTLLCAAQSLQPPPSLSWDMVSPSHTVLALHQYGAMMHLDLQYYFFFPLVGKRGTMAAVSPPCRRVGWKNWTGGAVGHHEPSLPPSRPPPPPPSAVPTPLTEVAPPGGGRWASRARRARANTSNTESLLRRGGGAWGGGARWCGSSCPDAPQAGLLEPSLGASGDTGQNAYTHPPWLDGKRSVWQARWQTRCEKVTRSFNPSCTLQTVKEDCGVLWETNSE